MTPIKFLFWNIHGNDLQDSIAQLSLTLDIDVLILAECKIPAAKMLQTLNSTSRRRFWLSSTLQSKLTMYTAFPDSHVKTVTDALRYSVFLLKLPDCVEVLIVAAHLQSKAHWSDDSQALECPILSDAIADEEKRAGHSRTIVLARI